MSVLVALAMQVAAQPSQRRHEVTQADLHAMADACHVPRDTVVMNGSVVVFRSGPNVDFTQTECVLRKVSAVVPMNRISFIGNAPASEEN
ncbi:hypothetical protein J2Y58_002977 [Sphingomonas sp. BE138]|uniref:hypothetical protein n=1 Tax=Sphingomonas sp. BE138 TaxID=2817845 RepID=UPI002864211A|nr:hypothetical protein [Sphingomonas sp. BE138]MDR6789604.1 hypothetical protein [Sphingomonas sp. BE138]